MRFLEWLADCDAPQRIHVSVPVSAPLRAVINIGPQNLPPGLAASTAIATVKTAIDAMSGATWISVRPSPRGTVATVEMLTADGAGPEIFAVRAWLESVVKAALSPHFVTPDLAFEPNAQSDVAAEPAPAPPGPADAIDTRNLGALSDAELLARLLSYVAMVGGAERADLAIERFGSFTALLSASEIELANLPGLGGRFIAAIKLVHAAARRSSRPAQPMLNDTMQQIDYLNQNLDGDRGQPFRVLYLDAAGRLRSDEAQAGAALPRSPGLPRKVVARALELKAASILLVFSLLNGTVSPSADHLRLTAMIQDAGSALGLTVKVHITIENGEWPALPPDARYPQA